MVKWQAVAGHLALERLQMSMGALVGRTEGDNAQRALDRIDRAAFPEG